MAESYWLRSYVGIVPRAFELILAFCRFLLLALGAQTLSEAMQRSRITRIYL